MLAIALVFQLGGFHQFITGPVVNMVLYFSALVLGAGSGVDIGPLKEFNTPLVGFVTDSENYFDWHHSPNDTFDKIDFEDFQSGSAAITSLIYLVDRYGLEDIKE